MKITHSAGLLAGLALLAGAAVRLATAEQPSEPPLADQRLSVHTLLREDVFAGILEKDMDRLARGEKNIETLLAQRPKDKAPLLVWKGGVVLYRAVLALEAGRHKEFEEKYKSAVELLAEGKKLGPKDFGVTAATAGIYSIFADRLPEKLRGPAWATAYDSYQLLWKNQERFAQTLSLHLKGELLGGLAESAQRTGHQKELDEYLDKILKVAPNSAYAKVARQWKDDPTAATRTRITCLSCHAAGRLEARQAALRKEKE